MIDIDLICSCILASLYVSHLESTKFTVSQCKFEMSDCTVCKKYTPKQATTLYCNFVTVLPVALAWESDRDKQPTSGKG